MKNVKIILVLLFFSCFVTACGGGGPSVASQNEIKEIAAGSMDVEVPEPQEVAVTEFKAPDLPKIEIPDIELPEPPKI